MDLQLQGKHVLITGGSKGIGLACARGFLARRRASEPGFARARTTWSAAARAGAALLGGAAADAAARIATFAADLKDPAAAVAALDAAEQAWARSTCWSTRPAPPSARGPTTSRRRPGTMRWTPSTSPTSTCSTRWSSAWAQRGSGVIVNVDRRRRQGREPDAPVRRRGQRRADAGQRRHGRAYGPKGVRVNAVNPGLTLTERLKEGMAADAKLAGHQHRRGAGAARTSACRSAGSPRRRRSPTPSSSSPRRAPATSPARSWRWTARSRRWWSERTGWVPRRRAARIEGMEAPMVTRRSPRLRGSTTAWASARCTNTCASTHAAGPRSRPITGTATPSLTARSTG